MSRQAVPENTTSAVHLAVSAQLAGSDSTDRPQAGSVVHTRRPTCPKRRPSSARAPPLRTLQPGARFCAVCLAAALLSVQVSPLTNGCRGSARPMLACRRKTSSTKPCLVARDGQALGAVSLQSCPPAPSRPPAAAFSSPGTRRVSSLSAAQSARASSGRCARRQSQH